MFHLSRLLTLIAAAAGTCAVLTGGMAVGFSAAPAIGSASCGSAKGKTLLAAGKTRIYSLPGSKPQEAEPIYGCLVSTAHQSSTCGSAEGRTLVAGRKGRIYALPSPKFQRARVVYGCLVGSGRTVRLGWLYYGPFALHMPWIAGVTLHHHGRDSRRLEVIARNLSSGQRRSCQVGAGHSPRAAGDVIGIALKRNGSLAWAGHSPYGWEGGHRLEVVACDSQGERLLDSGPGIELGSLSLRGSTLTWTDAGVTRTGGLR